jgi:hypothetical protein
MTDTKPDHETAAFVTPQQNKSATGVAIPESLYGDVLEALQFFIEHLGDIRENIHDRIDDNDIELYRPRLDHFESILPDRIRQLEALQHSDMVWQAADQLYQAIRKDLAKLDRYERSRVKQLLIKWLK